MKAWIKYLIIGGILIAAVLIVVPNLLTSFKLSAALRANEQLRVELEATRGELEAMRTALASAEAENLALGASLEASQQQLGAIKDAIATSQATAGALGETNQELIDFVRDCIRLVREIKRALEDGRIRVE